MANHPEQSSPAGALKPDAKKGARGKWVYCKDQSTDAVPVCSEDEAAALEFLKSKSLRSTYYLDFSCRNAVRCLRKLYREGKEGGPKQEIASFLYDTALRSAEEALSHGLDRQPLYWDNPEALADACTKLMVLGAAEETEDSYVILLYGMVCFAMERYADAQKSFAKLEGSKSSDQPPSALLLYVPRVLNVPGFMNVRLSRGSRAWKLLEGKGAALLKAYRKAPLSRDFPAEFTNLSTAFLDRSDLGILFMPDGSMGTPFQPASQAAFFLFSPDLDLELDLFPIEITLDQMPESLMKDWTPYVGRPAFDPRALTQEAIPGVRWDDIRISVSDSPDHTGADVLIHHPYLLELSQDSEADAQHLGRLLVCMVLGELEAAVNLRSLTISPDELPRDTSRRLPILPRMLKKLGYPEAVSPMDLEQKLRRSYTRTPAAPGGPLRSDITSGWTDCWRLVDEYDRSLDDAFVHYLNMGVAAGFLVWPKSLLAGSSRAEFMEKLTAVLDNSHAFHGYRIIGEAESPDYCYLDLLLWTVLPVIKELERFFQGIPHGDQVRFQAFRPGSEPAPVCVSFFRSKGAEEESTKRSGFVPSTSGSSGSRAGKKGKRRK